MTGIGTLLFDLLADAEAASRAQCSTSACWPAGRPARPLAGYGASGASPTCPCEARLVMVEGATHLFEETGTLERAADAAREWFAGHMAPARSLR